jgi:hypothetical protein
MMRIPRNVTLVCLFVTIALAGRAQSHFQAESGVLDARALDFSHDKLALKGYWTFYDKALLTPATASGERGINEFFPQTWNGKRKDGSGLGFGTYTLRVLVPDGLDSLALEIPQLYNCYALWVNGDLVASAGKVGTSRKETTPYWTHQIRTFSLRGKDTLNIILQIANFHHYKGGAQELIYMATPDRTKDHFGLARTTNIIAMVVLLLEGIFFLAIFAMKQKQVAFYFALLCITWSVRALFSNLYLVVDFVPDISWNLLVRVEYMSLYFAMIWSNLLLYFLFRKVGSSQILAFTLVGINTMFVLFTLFTPPLIFTKWISLYLGLAAITVIYGAVMVVRALFFEHAGAWFLMASILTGVIMFGYDIVAYQLTFSYNFIFLNIGYTIMFMLIMVALLFHLDIIKSNHADTLLTYDDLFRKG